ncbi:amidohydrolase family protein [Alkalimonas amylolytica]|uniref:Imidazolonepropionase n=1 Tax=Alkalimonas amylolytica TaxID=152573 RepID=A0A1H3X3N7_ALKAM|nr:amidohydrolase family protein [Alkalimonas amylolytica]SDZ94006.1 Imidazolonepropionase [Alkalimonas amylolytica]
MKGALKKTSYLLGLSLVAANLQAETLVVLAERIYTQAGPVIEAGAIVVEDGKIRQVGRQSQLRLPAGAKTLQAAVVTPGLIDARTVVGLAGYLNQPHDQDQLETSAAMQPQLRALDAFNARERLVDWVRSLGVTTFHTGHGPGALISGQTMVRKSHGNHVDDGMMQPLAMIAAQLGPGAFGAENRSPGTRSKQIAMLRQQLIRAQEYQQKQQEAQEGKAPSRDLELEALVGVLNGSTPLLITAYREQDMQSALRIAEEFGIRIVLDGAAEAYLMLDAIKAAQVPVILHPTMARQFGELENASFITAQKLHQAGIPFALQSGYERYVPKTRVVLWEAAIAAAYGLPYEVALASITIDAARILGIDERVGSIAVGKDADLVLYTGDPFEYTTQVSQVIINGQLVSTEPH